jgi:hypothetical protein
MDEEDIDFREGSVEDLSMEEGVGNNQQGNFNPPAAAAQQQNGVEMINNNNMAAAPPANRPAAARVPAFAAVPNNNATHQSLLRQQAHSPAHGNLPAGNRGVAAGPARNNNPLERLELPQQPPQNQQLNIGANNPNPNNVPERETETETVMHPCSPSNSASSGWSVVEAPQGVGGHLPSARSLHAGALLNNSLYIFGGYDGVQRVNSFHAYSFAEKRWSPVLPSANSAGPPSPRDRHVAVAFGNSFYVHGGNFLMALSFHFMSHWITPF